MKNSDVDVRGSSEAKEEIFVILDLDKIDLELHISGAKRRVLALLVYL